MKNPARPVPSHRGQGRASGTRNGTYPPAAACAGERTISTFGAWTGCDLGTWRRVKFRSSSRSRIASADGAWVANEPAGVGRRRRESPHAEGGVAAPIALTSPAIASTAASVSARPFSAVARVASPQTPVGE